MLSTGAFNALLKTVEEPPAHVVFIMATTEQQKVPPTILSRSQCFRFRPISEADIITRLKEVTAAEKIKTEPEALKLIARSAGGALRDALTMLDRAASFGRGEVNADVINELLGHPGAEVVNSLALALVNRDAAALHSAFDKLNGEGHDPLAALRDLRNNFAEAFLASQGFSEGSPIKDLPKDLQPGTLARLSRKLSVVIEELKFSDSLALAAEVALFTLIEVPQNLEAMVKKLEELEARLASGAGPAPRPAVAEAPVQKKNDYLAPAPQAQARPAQERVSEPSPEPAPAATRTAPADAWKKLLGQVSARKPALYNILLSVKIVFTEADKWRLISASKFEASMVETARPELEEMLARCAGMKISLKAEFAAGPVAGAEEISGSDGEEAMVEDSPEQEPDPLAQPRAHGAKPAAGDAEPELKHLNKVFHGRITRINKVK
jgi:DNA polymerase-3 subunit gamma/tau